MATDMGKADVLSSPSLKKTIIIAGSGALAGGLLLAGLTIAPRSAAALPTYSQRENKPCGYCHVDPEGGSVRNAVGKQYEENGHTFKKK